MSVRHKQLSGLTLLAVLWMTAQSAHAQDDEGDPSAPTNFPADADKDKDKDPSAPPAPSAAPPSDSDFPTVFGAEGLEDKRAAPPAQAAASASSGKSEGNRNQYLPGAAGLRYTTGMLPTKPDLGSEADLLSTSNVPTPPALTQRWNYALQGYFQAPLRVGLGPRNDLTEGRELHSPPRMVGLEQYEWRNLGLIPGPVAALYIRVENSLVSANVVLSSNILWDSAFRDIQAIGGISQAFVTLKWPDLFGSAGGLAWTVGAFSSRYGNAGPRQQSSGYYRTQLFGRTHLAGEAVTADLNLGPDLELVLEQGLGGKVEVVPFLSPDGVPPPPRAPWLPEQGPVAQGSTFVHHSHAALAIGDWLTLGAHYLGEWSPNDYYTGAGEAEKAKMNVFGGDVHFDSDQAGYGYVGYSRLDASNALPLADGLEVIHSINGLSLTENYFQSIGDEYYAPGAGQLPPPVDSGTIDTVLFQYLVRLSNLLGSSSKGRDAGLALFGMYNHVATDIVTQDRFKFGVDTSVDIIRALSLGLRFDSAMPDGSNKDVAFSVISPRVVLHTNWLSREYVVFSYSHFFLGEGAAPSPPYDNLTVADSDVFRLSAQVSF
jgi:hypothetical protein